MAILLLFTAAVSANSYQLNTGDRISISVWGHSDLSRETEIDPDGLFSFPLVGSIEAEGKTTTEIQAELKTSLADYIINPEVNVNLTSYRKLRVLVMGEVSSEGSYEIRADNKLLDVISLAGGITDRARAEQSKLQRGEESFSINLKELLKGNNLEDNLKLEDGDQVYIPQKEIKRATIQGEIRSPGHYELEADREMKLNDLLATAGSISAEAGEKIRIISNNQAKEFDLDDTMAAREGSNPILKDGDSIYIPSRLKEVTILGQINNPGKYAWNEDMRLANLIAQAGNPTDRAELTNIRFIKENGEIKEINMEDFFDNNDLSANPKLNSGDLVIVGETDSTDWQKVFFMFSGFNSIKNFFGW